MKIKQVLSNLINIRHINFKMTLFILLIGYVLVLFNITLSQVRIDDPKVIIKPVEAEVREKYREFTAQVKTGLLIKNFVSFNFMKNNFVIDGIVWFEFDSSEMMLKKVEKFSFENGRILYKSPPDMKMYGNRIFVKYKVVFEVRTNLDFHHFPISDHRLSIVMSNDFVSPGEMYFDDKEGSLSFTIGENLFTSNWKPYALDVQSGYSSMVLDKTDAEKKAVHPQVVFTIDFKKAGIKKVLIIFIPLFAAAFFSIFSFLVSMANYRGIFSLAITAMTALLGYRFVIEQLSPKVGYFTTTDSLYIFFLIFSFIVFLLQLLLTRKHFQLSIEKKKTELDRLKLFTDIAFLFFVTVFVVFVTYFLFS